VSLKAKKKEAKVFLKIRLPSRKRRGTLPFPSQFSDGETWKSVQKKRKKKKGGGETKTFLLNLWYARRGKRLERQLRYSPCVFISHNRTIEKENSRKKKKKKTEGKEAFIVMHLKGNQKLEREGLSS